MVMTDRQRDEDAGDFESFKLLDVDGTSSAGSSESVIIGSGTRSPTVGVTPEDSTLSTRLASSARIASDVLHLMFGYTTLNVAISCSALAMAKQLVNPSSYIKPQEARDTASQLPKWFAAQYQNGRIASDFTRSVIKDTSVLMAASATWYGVQAGLKAVRGHEDAANVCVAGTLSAALLGAFFFEPFKPSRIGVWGALGGVAGYFGYQEQQALLKALLQRQQELEQKHLHKQPDEVHEVLNSKLLKRLLELEQQERLDQLKQNMQQHGVVGPDGQLAADATKGVAATANGSSSGGSGAEWRDLINAAPWLQDDHRQSQWQQQQQQHPTPQHAGEQQDFRD